MRAATMLELSPPVTATRASARATPACSSTSRSKAMPSTACPRKRSPSRSNARGSLSTTDTVSPRSASAIARPAPTRPQPTTRTLTNPPHQGIPASRGRLLLGRLVGHEAVAHAGLGHDDRGCRGVVQLLAQVRHVDAQVLRLLLVAGPPDAFEQEAVGAEAPGIGGEHLDEPVFGAGEVDGLAAPGDQFGVEVDADVAGLHEVRARQGALGLLAVPQCDLDPRQQLGHAEGLGHVVVGAELEGGDL